MPRPLHIAFITVADLPQGGGNTTRLERLAAALARAGHHVRIWNEHALGVASADLLEIFGRLGEIPFEYVLGSTARSTGFSMIPTKLQAVRAIARRVRAARARNKLDILWFNTLSFYDTWPLTRLARRLGIRTIQSYEDEHQVLVSQNRLSVARHVFAWNSWLGDRVCPGEADAVIVISHYLKEKYLRLTCKPERVHLVPTIIDCNLWDCTDVPEEVPPIILYSGTFGEQDEIEKVVRACARLRGEGHDFRLVLLGGNDRAAQRVAEVQRLIADLDLGSLVEMKGFVPVTSVREHIARASILINIRRDGIWSRSGLSTKLSEYLASGRLVISSTVGEVPRYLTDGGSALLVSAGSTVHEIQQALGRALASPQMRKEVGRQGRQVALREFHISGATAMLESILAGL